MIHITLYDNNGALQSAGLVTVSAGRVSLGPWLFGGEHVHRRPLGLIRRIALDAAEQQRSYSGLDEQTGIQYAVEAP